MAATHAPDAMISSAAVSQRGMFRIQAYTPREGEQGIPITVHTKFVNHFPTRRIFLRLVIGSKAIGTEIRRMEEGQNEIWRLEGSIPPFHIHKSNTPTVAVSVQAVDSDNNVLDTITFGEFTYWSSGDDSPLVKHEEQLPSSSRIVPPQQYPADAQGQRRISPGPRQPAAGSSSRSRAGVRRVQLLRRRDAGDAADGTSERAVLEFLTPLDEVGHNLTEEEKRAGRRLIRFTRKQEGHRLRVACHPIRPEEYDERAVVISCIYRASTGVSYVTSVDIIYLLQYFVQDQFSVEEKNRIRRNLEGFRPVTISKSRAGSEVFFQQIMEFPMPKPRNIEKDVKVFTWDTLGAALDKIIAKYSLFTVTQPSVPSPSSSSTHSVDPLLADAEPLALPAARGLAPPTLGYPLPEHHAHHAPQPHQPLYPPYERAHFAETPPQMQMSYAPAQMDMDVNLSMMHGGLELEQQQQQQQQQFGAGQQQQGAGQQGQDVYHTPPMEGGFQTFDSMEFQTLREHAQMGMATQYL